MPWCAMVCHTMMVLQWTWAGLPLGAMALLERTGLALCVGLALEMRCISCSSAQLCRC